jgi:FkbM family methyltransferase
MANSVYNSQFSQDEKILRLLNYKQNGYFLDIGCSDPKNLSNTYVLEKEFNWKGLAVDPRKKIKHAFTKERNCSFEEAAVYTHDGIISFSDLGVRSGINESDITDQVTENINSVYDVSCITLKSLFKKYNVPTVIDYMSLDVEGAELLILKTFPFLEYTLLTATIEHNSHVGEKQKQKGNEIIELMSYNNFKLVEVLGADFLFINKQLLNAL